MNRRMVLYVTGRVTFVVGVLMILPILVALIYHEGTDTIYPLFQAMVATMAVGAAMASRPPKRRSIYVREGLAITGLSWIMLVIFGSLPYLFTGAIPSIPDAIFETASGFTTTGSSILSEIESLPRSVLFWRNFTVFIGGMGVLVFAVALLPKSNSEDIYILKSEMPGPTFDKVLSRVRTVARVFYVIYAVLTLILICILIGAGMSPYDAILHAFATAGTGGFSNYTTSIAAFESVPIELILAFGMLIFSVNFNLYFFALRGRWREALKSDELRWFVAIVLAAVLAIVLNILPMYDSLWLCIKDAFFNVATIISTTGFCTVDYCQWPMFSQLILLLLMFIGGSPGSTAGGIKTVTAAVLVLTAISAFCGRTTVSAFGRTIAPRSIMNAVTLLMAGGVLCLVGACAIAGIEDAPFHQCLFEAVSAFGTVGVSMGLTPTLAAASRVILIVMMYMGRVGVLTLGVAVFMRRREPPRLKYPDADVFIG